MVQSTHTEVVVVGSGFGGCLTALILDRLGLDVAVVDRAAHPRFAIGESSTPLANMVLADLCRRYGLPQFLPLAKYGPWRRAHPDVACGLKRGFSFFRHEPSANWNRR